MKVIAMTLALCGCAETPSGPAETALSLQIDITSGSGELFTLADGSTSMTDSFMKDYTAVTLRPPVATLPVTIQGTPVEIELDSCDLDGRILTTENLTYKDVSQLDQFGVVGILSWDCDYTTGPPMTGSKSAGVVGNPNSPAPPL